jgi:hypothetical protein
LHRHFIVVRRKRSPSFPKKKVIQLKLSANGLANITVRDDMNDFEFVVGQSRHRCPSFVADFLSPRISALHAADCTLNEFRISTEDAENSFASFLSLGRGLGVSVTSSNRDFFVSLSE